MTSNVPVSANGAQYHLPAIPRLLARGRHPRIGALEPAHDRWLNEWLSFITDEQRRHILNHRNALWTAVTYPTTTDDRFHDLARITTLLFAFDDLCLNPTGPAHVVKAVYSDMLTVLSGGG